MEMDIHGEIDNWVSPPRIQKVEEVVFQRGLGYRGLGKPPRLIIDATLNHIEREIDRESGERVVKRHGLPRSGRYSSEG